MHARAPLWTTDKRQFRPTMQRKAYMVRRRDFALVNRYNGPVGAVSILSRVRVVALTNESSPTPNPAIILPITIIQKPGVIVCIAPPIANTTAPEKRVPLRPRISPMRPAAIDVTCDRHFTQFLRGYMHRRNGIPKAPTSNTATIVPTSNADGLLKNLRK